MNLRGSGFPDHGHQLAGRCSADNRIVDQDHPLVFEAEFDPELLGSCSSVLIHRETLRVRPVQDRMASLGVLRKAFRDALGDVAATATDRVDRAQPFRGALPFELDQPIAVHHQSDPGGWILASQDGREGGEIHDQDRLETFASDLPGDSSAIGTVVPGSEEVPVEGLVLAPETTSDRAKESDREVVQSRRNANVPQRSALPSSPVPTSKAE